MTTEQANGLLALMEMYPDDTITCMENAGSTDAEADIEGIAKELADAAADDSTEDAEEEDTV